MRVKSLFSSVSIEQFALHHHASYTVLLDTISSALEKSFADYSYEVNNLYEAYGVAPKETIETLKKIRKSDHEVDSFIESQAFLGAWFLDGGSLDELDPKSRSKTEGHDERNPSAHWILFMLGYNDSCLALKATAESLKQRFETDHHVKGARATDSFALTMRLSLMGFCGKANPASYLFSNPVTGLYLDNLCPNVVTGAPLKPIALTFLNEILTHWKIEDSVSIGVFNKILKCLIYNPGLRLKALGCQTEQIIGFLDPLIQALENKIDGWFGVVTASASKRVFKRQLYLNLFSPFAEDLRYLDAKPFELLGHPGFDGSIPSFMLETLQGPYACHSGKQWEGDAVPSYQLSRLGLPVDADMVLEGALNNGLKAQMIFGEFGCSPCTGDWLLKLLDTEPGAEFSLGKLADIERFFSFEKHDKDAQLGIMALMAVLGWKHQVSTKDSGKICELKGSGISDPSYRLKISENPELGRRLLAFMESHKLFDGALLHWLGFTSHDLAILNPTLLDECREFFLAQDLGL